MNWQNNASLVMPEWKTYYNNTPPDFYLGPRFKSQEISNISKVIGLRPFVSKDVVQELLVFPLRSYIGITYNEWVGWSSLDSVYGKPPRIDIFLYGPGAYTVDSQGFYSIVLKLKKGNITKKVKATIKISDQAIPCRVK